MINMFTKKRQEEIEMLEKKLTSLGNTIVELEDKISSIQKSVEKQVSAKKKKKKKSKTRV